MFLKWTPRWTSLGAFALLALAQLVIYQNCGADFVVKDGLSLASTSSVCEEGLIDNFKSSYQTFLKTNCKDCHTSAGPGNGAFADSNADLAFNAFLNIGYERVDVNALSSSHAGSYTGPQNSSAITLASQQWAAAEATCKAGTAGSGGTTIDIKTTNKIMNAAATAKDITFLLDSELNVAGLNSGGAKLIVAVIEAPSANGTPVYYFSNPRLVGGTKSVSLTGLMVRINGQEQVLGSTWSRVSATAVPGATVVLSTAQMIVEYPAYATSDTLALSIDSVSAQ